MNLQPSQRLVYVVEDDVRIASVLSDYLTAEGFLPRCFSDPLVALASARSQPPALVLLDIMLPGIDGLAFCHRLRAFCDCPIIMLTARISTEDKVAGLSAGADDYVVKPFSPGEVMARVHAHLRRAEGRLAAAARSGGYVIDEAGMRISWKGQWLDLSLAEYAVASALMRQPERSFTRGQLLDSLLAVLGERTLETSERAVDSHIKNIRRKILAIDPGGACIATVYGLGYRFSVGLKAEGERRG